MKNEMNAMIDTITATTPEPEDYITPARTVCCTAASATSPKKPTSRRARHCLGIDRHPAECDCQRTTRDEQEAAEQRRRHFDTVEELKHRGFTDPTMRDWTFENDNGRNPQTKLVRRYVKHWEDMRVDNIGYLFWGGVGTGKSYLAGCIAPSWRKKFLST